MPCGRITIPVVGLDPLSVVGLGGIPLGLKGETLPRDIIGLIPLRGGLPLDGPIGLLNCPRVIPPREVIILGIYLPPRALVLIPILIGEVIPLNCDPLPTTVLIGLSCAAIFSTGLTCGMSTFSSTISISGPAPGLTLDIVIFVGMFMSGSDPTTLLMLIPAGRLFSGFALVILIPDGRFIALPRLTPPPPLLS